MFSDGAVHIFDYAQTATHIDRKRRSYADSHHSHHSHHIVDVSRRVDRGNASGIEIGVAMMAISQLPMQVIWERTMDSVWSDG